MARIMPDFSERGAGGVSSAFSIEEDWVDGGRRVEDAVRARSCASSRSVAARRGCVLDKGDGGAAMRTTDLNASRNCRTERFCGYTCIFLLV